MTHGTRGCYVNQECRCLLCRASEADYRARLRLARAKGKLTAGRRISAVEARRILRQLKSEGYTKGEIAWALGRQQDRRAVRRTQSTITLGRFLAIRKLFRERVLHGQDGADCPIDERPQVQRVAVCDKKNDSDQDAGSGE